MKNKKCIAMALVILACLLLLCACVQKPMAQSKQLELPTLGQNQMAVIIKNSDDLYTTYTVDLFQNLTTVADVLQHLSQNQGMQLDYANDLFGAYLNNVGGICPDRSQNQFVAFFTTVDSCKGNWAGVPSYDVGGTLLVSAGVGVSQAPAEAGSIAYFELSSYNIFEI